MNAFTNVFHLDVIKDRNNINVLDRGQGFANFLMSVFSTGRNKNASLFKGWLSAPIKEDWGSGIVRDMFLSVKGDVFPKGQESISNWLTPTSNVGG
jgi:hypothetical protein